MIVGRCDNTSVSGAKIASGRAAAVPRFTLNLSMRRRKAIVELESAKAQAASGLPRHDRVARPSKVHTVQPRQTKLHMLHKASRNFVSDLFCDSFVEPVDHSGSLAKYL